MKPNAHQVSRARGLAISRRQLLTGAAAVAGGLVPLSARGIVRADDPTRVRLSLPAPTGPYPIGTVSLHLVDIDRPDPWSMKPRELMVSVWYPAGHAGRWDVAPWMSSGALAAYREYDEIKLKASLDGVEFPFTHGREGAPVRHAGRPWPVVLYSPSGAEARAVGTTQVEDLAGHGYVVVTIDHTYDAIAVEFPRGRVELNPTPPIQPGPPPPGAMPVHIKVAVHRADARFVLDQVAAIADGKNPDAEHHPLPAGLRGSLDMDRVGMFGHSFGGCATAQTMAHDERVRAGIILDGSILPDVPLAGGGPGGSNEQLAAIGRQIGNRPVMFMSSGGRGPDQLGALVSVFWENVAGWRRFLSLVGSSHATYVDDVTLNSQLAAAGVIPAPAPGRIDPVRAVAAQRAYIRAFFDLWLRGHDSQLLDAPSPDYPEVLFIGV